MAPSMSVSRSSHIFPLTWNAMQSQCLAQWRKHSQGSRTLSVWIVWFSMLKFSMNMLLMKISGVSIWLLAVVIGGISRNAVPQLSHRKVKYKSILFWKIVQWKGCRAFQRNIKLKLLNSLLLMRLEPNKQWLASIGEKINNQLFVHEHFLFQDGSIFQIEAKMKTTELLDTNFHQMKANSLCIARDMFHLTSNKSCLKKAFWKRTYLFVEKIQRNVSKFVIKVYLHSAIPFKNFCSFRK